MHPNADVVRRGYEAFNRGDLEALDEMFDEDACWHTPGRIPIAGDHEGRDAVFVQFARYGRDTGSTFKAELKTVLADDEGRVVGLHHNSAQREGKQLDTGCCIVFALEDGRITDGREYFFNQRNWDDFWS